MITFKDCIKSVGTILVCACSAFLTFLFQEFRLDLMKFDKRSLNELQISFYDAQISQSNIMIAVSGGILTLFALVTLFFSITRFIKENEANMGLLKALGYSKIKISLSFFKYGINPLLGCLFGYLVSLAFKSTFYFEMNKDAILPEVEIGFHPLFVILVIAIPTILFSLISFLVAYLKLNKNPLHMIKCIKNTKVRLSKDNPNFEKGLRNSIMRNHISIILFVGFASLCFGATVQMSFSMDQIGTSPLFFWMMFLIGLLLGVSILYIAFSFTYQVNRDYMALMKAYGYRDKECLSILYEGYIPVSIIGFAIGTVYQYLLMKLMINIFQNVENITFEYNLFGLLYTILLFIPIYIIIEVIFFYRMKKQSITNVLIER